MLSTGKLLILLHEEELVKKIGAQNTSHPLDTECFSKIVRTDKDDFFMNVLDGFCGLKLKNRARRLDRRGAYSKNPGARHPQTLRLEGGAYKVVQTKAGEGLLKKRFQEKLSIQQQLAHGVLLTTRKKIRHLILAGADVYYQG